MAFRVSPDEDREIETAVRLSGLTKQDYITRRLLCRDVVVQGNPRVYKALRNELAAVLEELERIEAGNGVDGELLDTIRLIAAIMDGMGLKDKKSWWRVSPSCFGGGLCGGGRARRWRRPIWG